MSNNISIPYFDAKSVRNKNVAVSKYAGTAAPKNATALGSGVFGTVYMVTPQDARRIVDTLDARLKGVWSLPRGAKVALKVMKVPRAGARAMVVNFLRELYIQYHLSSAPAQRVHGKIFDVKKYVPTPYFGGYVRATNEFVICMKMQPGEPLSSTQLLRNKHHYLDIERAYISMLLNNVLHVDFHEGNIMVTPDGGVHLVDFGGAVLLSDTFKTNANLQTFRRRLYQFLEHWPHHVTYISQRKNINESLLEDMNTMFRIENALGIESKTASTTLSNMRGRIAKRANVSNLLSRNRRIQYKA